MNDYRSEFDERRGKGLPIFCVVFLLAIYIKQFYRGSSGSFQIGDILLTLSFALMVLTNYNSELIRENKPLITFVVCSFIVNGIYALMYDFNKGIIMSSVYLLFNLFAVLAFCNAIEYPRFITLFDKVLKLCLLTQGGIYLTGRGRWMEGVRYQGTFNDPNQYGFFILSVFFMLVLVSTMQGKRMNSILWLVITFLLLMPCASTGMMVGLLVYAAIYVVFDETKAANAKIIRLFVIAIIFVLFILLSKGYIHLPASIENSFMYERLMGKVEDLSEGSSSIIYNRGWDKVLNHPWYVFIGSGEGIYWRFGSGNEVHSTVLTLIWCYGIVPCSFLISWLKGKFRGLSQSVWCVYIALFVEAFTIVNHRQPMFWMILAIAGHYLLKDKRYRTDGV